jgi:hypothetical protein
MIKKIGSKIVRRLAIQKIMIPTFYQTHLKKQLTSAQFLVMTVLPYLQQIAGL